LKGDGERGFRAIAERMKDNSKIKADDDDRIKDLCTNPTWRRNVSFYLKDNTDGYHLTNSYCLVDSVIRVIRNLCGLDPRKFADHNTFFTIVRMYNNTVHKAFDNKFTPTEVQTDLELELAFMNRNEERAKAATLRQSIAGLRGYREGNIVLIHIPYQKTKLMFAKQRRNFSKLAEFLRYEGGNAVVQLLTKMPNLSDILVIPIYYTKFVSPDKNNIPESISTQLS
jgi:hypothetical protein